MSLPMLSPYSLLYKRGLSSFLQRPHCSCDRGLDGGCIRFKRWWDKLDVDNLMHDMLYDCMSQLFHVDYPVEVSEENEEVNQKQYDVRVSKGGIEGVGVNEEKGVNSSIGKALQEGVDPYVEGCRIEVNEPPPAVGSSDGHDVNESSERKVYIRTKDGTNQREVTKKLGKASKSCGQKLLGDYTYNCIQLDLARTFPNNSFFDEKGKNHLRRVLEAYAFYDPEVGYVQGMNFVAGFLLWHSNEQQAFWLLVAMMQILGLRKMYLQNLPGLYERLSQTKMLLCIFFPNLLLHLERCGADVSLFASEWLLTLFCSSIPFDPLSILWDYYFDEGWDSFYKLIIRRCHRMREKLMHTYELDTILSILKYENISNKGTSRELEDPTRRMRSNFTESVKELLQGVENVIDTDSSMQRKFKNSIVQIQKFITKPQAMRPKDPTTEQAWMLLIQESRNYSLDVHLVRGVERKKNFLEYRSELKRLSKPQCESKRQEEDPMSSFLLNETTGNTHTSLNDAAKDGDSIKCVDDSVSREMSVENTQPKGSTATQLGCTDEASSYNNEEEGLPEDNESVGSWEMIDDIPELLVAPPSHSDIAGEAFAAVAEQSRPAHAMPRFDGIIDELKVLKLNGLSMQLHNLRMECDAHRMKASQMLRVVGPMLSVTKRVEARMNSYEKLNKKQVA